MWVSPFRHPRINGYLLLPAAFRSLSRLSSALSAKASTLRSFLLNLHIRCIALHHTCFCFFSFTLVFVRCISSYTAPRMSFLSFCLISIFGFQGTTHRSNQLKIKPACIFIFICICIACLHAVSKSQICECGVLATRVPDAAGEASASEVQVV